MVVHQRQKIRPKCFGKIFRTTLSTQKDFRSVVLTVHMQDIYAVTIDCTSEFCLVAIECTSTAVLCMRYLRDWYSCGCFAATSPKQVFIHCNQCHMNADRSQKFSPKFWRNIWSECSTSDRPPYGTAYKHQVILFLDDIDCTNTMQHYTIPFQQWNCRALASTTYLHHVVSNCKLHHIEIIST